jgi:predicted ATPase/signal transduction histidine kinase
MTVTPGFLLTEMIFESGARSLYKAASVAGDEKVILKVLSDQDITSPDLLNLRREFEIAKTLDHPFIIEVKEYLEFNGGAAIVMEDFDGISLDRLIAQGPLPPADFLRLALFLCEALAHIHGKGIIHKDVKPANILVSADKKDIRIIDFGLATLIPSEEIVQENTKVLQGSLRYISPEQTGRMNRALDYRTDLYSLGATLYELLLGAPPFQSEDPMELVHAHLALQPAAPSQVNPDIPQVLSGILLKLLEKSAEDRYKSLAGLKYDLERCRQALEKTGSIPDFEIARRDISDRLSIPQKLYGREAELDILIQVFDRVGQGTSEFLLVSGSPGIGKSVLINEIQRPVTEKRGVFITGKFDQFQRDIPYSAMIDAFQELIKSLLGANEQIIRQWREKILEQVGANGQVVIDVIPALRYIIGPQPPVPPLPPAESANRFNLVFQRFVKAFSNGPTPLVLFLDDLQWADVPSLNLLNFILSGRDTSYLLIIGAYRDNEVHAGHSLSTLMSEVEKERKVERIHLDPLKIKDLQHILQDTFFTPPADIAPLAKLIFAKTKGNPFFVFEFIKSLYKRKLIAFDHNANRWQWSIPEIEQSNITENVVELMTDLLFSLDEKTRDLCSLAASIGNNFDLHTLSIVHEKAVGQTAEDLWQALHEGIIIPTSDAYKFKNTNPALAAQTNYRFLHDRVQQAAYSIIPGEQRAPIHLKIGQLLYRNLNEAERENMLFDIANHLNQGEKLITGRKERLNLATLNFSAGLKAKNSSAFAPAFRYFATAVSLLPTDCWQEDYDFTLQLFNEAVETAYLSGQEAETRRYADRIFTHARSLLDKTHAYATLVNEHGSNGRHHESVDICFELLEQLGVKLPKNPGQLHVLAQLILTKMRLRGQSVEELLALPEMTSRQWLSAMSVMSKVTGPAYIANTNLFILIVFKMIELSLKHGNNRYVSHVYGLYGIVMSGPLMQFDQTRKYMDLSSQLLAKYPADELTCKVFYTRASLEHFFHPLRQSAGIMFRNIQLGLETGDFLYASYAVFIYLNYKFYAGVHLPSLKEELDGYCSMLESLKQKVGLGWTNTIMQFIENLLDKEEINTTLTGSYYDEVKRLHEMQEGKDTSGICLLYIQKGGICCLFNEYDKALEYLKKADKLIDSVIGTNLVNSHNFYYGLTLAALKSNESWIERRKNIFQLKKRIKAQQAWAKYCPENNLARLALLKAELARLQDKQSEALYFYQKGLEYAVKYNFINEQALSYELRGKYYLEIGDQENALHYLSDARFHYNQWGAYAKVKQIEQLYRLKTTEKTPPSETVSQTTGSFSADTLDLNSVLKASQTLSSEVQLDELFKKMTYIVMENAGATKCAIFLKHDKTWVQEIAREAIAGKDSEILKPIPVSNANAAAIEAPVKIITYVKRSGQTLVVNSAADNPTYNDDPYIRRVKPKSILCFPFYSKGTLNGIIYLENNLMSGAFTEDRKQLLSVISSQIAISIENARLYKNLEEKVKERTLEVVRQKEEIEQKNAALETTLAKLQAAQGQLVEAEKMASLGQLTAGIAHELNNPVNYLAANVNSLQLNFQDLLELLEKYQALKNTTDPQAVVQDIEYFEEEIDLAYLKEEIDLLFEGMEEGAKRTSKIVLGLRNFSRLDEDDYKFVDIHEGIDSTLTLLSNKLGDRIRIHKNYGELPSIECLPGKINQVLMNVLNNAIQAIAGPGDIYIATESIEGAVSISIKDTGQGIKEEIKHRIFDPFFTTKDVGEGTGLGLSISYGIIENHHGTIKVNSEEGGGAEFIISLPLSQTDKDHPS